MTDSLNRKHLSRRVVDAAAGLLLIPLSLIAFSLPFFHSLALSGDWTTRLTQLRPGYWSWLGSSWLGSMVLFLSGSLLKLRLGIRRGSAAVVGCEVNNG